MKCSNPGCDNPVGKTVKGNWMKHCSRSCRSKHNSIVGTEKRKQTCMERYGSTCNLSTDQHREHTQRVLMEKYGVEHQMQLTTVKEKIKATNIKIYGVENPSQSQQVKDKKKQTYIDHYGVDHPLKSTEVQELKKKRSMSMYGVEHYSKTDEYKKKYRETCMQRYGVSNPSKLSYVKERISKAWKLKYGNDRHPNQQHISEDVLEKLENKDWLENNKHLSSAYLAEQLGVSYHTVIYAYNKVGVNRAPNTSIGQAQIVDYLSTLYSGNIVVNDRTVLDGKELDIYIPELSLAIEFDGLFWHSERSGRPRDYHQMKTHMCNQKGIRLIHILDTEWTNCRPVVESRLQNLLGKSERVHARKCEIRTLTSKECNNFFNHAHIQQSVNSSVAYGLFFDQKLVAAMSFGKPRYRKSAQWELLRYANTLSTSVVGGASRLFKHFVKIHQPESVVSYADLRWNTGNLYSRLGFCFMDNTAPNYWYTDNYTSLRSRVKFQKHKLEKLLPVFDKNLSEWENMKVNGYDRYWDCGNSVWVWQA